MDREIVMRDADLVGETIGVLPVAPLPMPVQVLEQPVGLWGRIVGLLSGGVRTRGVGH